MKLSLLLILYTFKNKIESRTKQSWYYKYLPARLAEGFTLAEVLLTLLIIGIVASMVIPALIQDSQDAELKVAYKKAFAVASQVVKQCYSESLFEPRSSFDDGAANENNFDVFMNKFSVQKRCINNNNNQCWNPTGETSNGAPTDNGIHAFIDSSGMAWCVRCTFDAHGTTGCTSNMILVDTNGFKRPNKYGKDRWALLLMDNNNQSTGIPVKVTVPGDYTTVNSMYCRTPPCYYKSWLSQ